ncbi:PilN domain-containing protein [Synechocystis sp. LKSZ1]|uniref:PilN domain-containing protein n=1 Tax=Synechocystis sp. LKSZ1 TaxID=3144951 RepID=UPI00336BEA4B
MYSLDVNFLKDRREDSSKLAATGTTIVSQTKDVKEQIPIYIGAAVLVILPALAGLATLVVGWQQSMTEQNIQELDTELTRITAQNKKIQEVNAKAAAIHEEVNGLIGVFDQVKPWSAILQDITDQTPAGVQISNIQQAGQQLTLNGFASNYSALNDFVLTLQNSQFFKADQTKLLTANEAPFPVVGENTVTEGAPANNPTNQPPGQAKEGEPKPTVVIPQGVKYTVQTQLTDTPDQQLMDDLIRKGAPGLVARFKLLEETGALKGPTAPAVAPPPAAPADAAPAPNP